MVVEIDKCTTRVRVQDAHGDDVKFIKRKEKEDTCLLYMETFTR